MLIVPEVALKLMLGVKFRKMRSSGMDATPLSFLRRVNPQMYNELDECVRLGNLDEAHRAYFDLCRYAKEKTRENAARFRPPSSVTIKGFERVKRVLSPETVASLRFILNSSLQAAEDGRNGDSYRCVSVPKMQIPVLLAAMSEVLNAQVVALIESTLKSNFYVNHYQLSRTLPGTLPLNRSAWHREATAGAQITLIVSLTDTGSEGEFGATEILPLGATRWLERDLSMNFVEPKPSLERLADCTQNSQILSQIEKPILLSGDVLVLAAAQTIHREVAPIQKARETLLLVLLPSLLPWDQMLRFTGTDYLESRAFGYVNGAQNPANL